MCQSSTLLTLNEVNPVAPRYTRTCDRADEALNSNRGGVNNSLFIHRGQLHLNLQPLGKTCQKRSEKGTNSQCSCGGGGKNTKEADQVLLQAK